MLRRKYKKATKAASISAPSLSKFKPSLTFSNHNPNRKHIIIIIMFFFFLKKKETFSLPQETFIHSFISRNRASKATCNSLLAARKAFSILFALAIISFSITALFFNNPMNLSTRCEWAFDLVENPSPSGGESSGQRNFNYHNRGWGCEKKKKKGKKKQLGVGKTGVLCKWTS